jgi:hypothetical protein
MTWFELFRDRPLIFHAFQYALAIHHDLLCNQINWSQSPQVIAHKARTLGLLNQTLSNLSNENIELAILAVLVLAANELKPEQLLSDTVLLFNPHLPGANWNSVYARMEQASRIPRAPQWCRLTYAPSYLPDSRFRLTEGQCASSFSGVVVCIRLSYRGLLECLRCKYFAAMIVQRLTAYRVPIFWPRATTFPAPASHAFGKRTSRIHRGNLDTSSSTTAVVQLAEALRTRCPTDCRPERGWC